MSLGDIALAEVREAEGDVVEADALFQEAVGLLEPSGFGNCPATAREHRARFLVRRGRADEARLQLDRVPAFYVDPLAERHRQRVDALLAAAASTA